MSNPISFRFPFESQIAKLPPDVQMVHRTTWNAITDLQNAIPLLKTQIETNKSAITENTSTIENNTTNTETIIEESNTIGLVNNQSGETAYSTQPSDNGAFIVLGDTSAIALTLSVTMSGITLPWFCWVFNTNTGLVTATPAAGTISFPGNLGATSMTIPQNFAAFVEFDGTNFWAILVPVSPQDTPNIANQWLSAYNATTGAFTQSQPAFTDISGNLTTGQLPTAGLTVVITTAALTVGGTQGSQTFTDGILTAQTQAT